MARSTYLEFAAAGLRMPIGTHLVLQSHADPDAILLDGSRLGAVIAETAHRFATPLAMPLMDLSLEKTALLLACGVPAAEVDSHHFTTAPETPDRLPLTPRMNASCEAIAHVAAQPGLIPMGMSIGPFSLMTKLVADPITPVFLAGSGLTAADEPEVDLVERLLALGERIIHRYLHAQIDAGARAMIVCEPAANLVYFSPLQLQATPEIFERFVMAPMQRIAHLLAARGVDLIFHDCGELTDDMVRCFDTLRAVMLSFGSSRKLWLDAALVSKDTVLYGNLPSKRFCASELTTAEVGSLAGELFGKMQAAGHPFILGSECDVLSVPGCEHEIFGKVNALMACSCPGPNAHGSRSP